MSAGLCSLWRLQERSFFQLLAFIDLWLLLADLCLHLPMAAPVCLCHLLSCLLEGHLLSDLGPTWGIRNGLISRTLITSAKTPFPPEITFTHFRNLSADLSVRAHYSIHYTFLPFSVPLSFLKECSFLFSVFSPFLPLSN